MATIKTIPKDYDYETLLPDFVDITQENLLALNTEAAQSRAEAEQEHAAETKRVNAELDKKADKTQYASISQAGLIKLYSGSGVNRSGLIVGADGTTYVACSTNGGITRDGAGGLKIKDGGVTGAMIADNTITAGNLVTELTEFINDESGNFYLPSQYSLKKLSDKIKSIEGMPLNDGQALHYTISDQSPTGTTDGHPGDVWFVGNPHVVSECYICGGLNSEYSQYNWYKIYPHADDEARENISVMQNEMTYLTEDVTALKNNEYITIPQRIGTWIDGTPIWRVAFKAEFGNNTEIYAPLPLKTKSNALVLGIVTVFQNAGTPNMYDDVIVYGYNSESVDYTVMESECVIRFSSNSGYYGVTGYIEFATPESNLKTT